jgi:hypothetical protein
MNKTQTVAPELDLIIRQYDMTILRAHVRGKKDSVGKLIERIIHEWAIRRVRSPKNHLSLPIEVGYLFEGESLRSYINRVALVIIATLYREHKKWCMVADRLGYERSAFSKLISRLKRNLKGPPIMHFNPLAMALNSDGALPLKRVIKTHVTSILQLCNGNKEEACKRLGISLSRLNRILVNAAAETKQSHQSPK